MRRHLRTVGSADASTLALVAGVKTGLVSALLKYDVALGRVAAERDGDRNIYRHVEQPPLSPGLSRAIEQLEARGFIVIAP